MKRTNPVGVRFDPDKLEFIKQREKLQTNQQVVDLLINRYWWEHKMPVPTHREAPPLHLKEERILPLSKKEEVAMFNYEHKDQLTTISEAPTFQELLNGMAKLVFSDEKDEYEHKIRAATYLTPKQIQLLLLNLRQ